MPRPLPKSHAPARAASTSPAEVGVRFGARNFALLAAGLVALLAGYVLLAGGSTTAAPLLLVLGYVVLIPLGIIR